MISYRRIKLSCFSLGVSSLASGAGAFEVPERCRDRLAESGICVDAWESEVEPGTAQVESFVILYKEDFSSLSAATDKFFDFPAWKDYYAAAQFDKMEVIHSVAMPDTQKTNAAGNTVRVRYNYFNIATKIPVIGKQYARGVVSYEQISLKPSEEIAYHYEIAKTATEVPLGQAPLPDGHEGLVKQSGDLVFADCANFSGVCNDDEYLVYYNPQIRYKIALLPKYTARAAQEQIEALFTGMYLR